MSTQTIDIESLAYGGDGVGHLADGRVAFVAGAFAGDVVRASFADDGKSFVRARLDELVEASPERVEPPCAAAAAGLCGGCPWAQLAYDAQLAWKRRSVADAFVRIGGFTSERVECLLAPTVASARQWGYRNKVEFEVGQDVAGRMTLGMHARGGSFAPLASCKLCAGTLEKAPKALTGALRYALSDSDTQLLRVGLRHSRRTSATEVAIWTTPGRFPRAAVAKVVPQALAAKHVGVTRVMLKGSAKQRKVAGVESLAGRGFWAERIGEYEMRISAPSFFQVNTAGAETLVTLVLEALEPSGLDTVLDLYAGAGTFTLPLAQRAGGVVAVEMAGSSVRDLRRNLERAGLDAEVVGGDVGRELAALGAADSVVVDPPRAGLGAQALEGLSALAAHRIAYVSCNPTTLARDVAALCSGGYELRAVTPVDLFPQSYHVECVAVLERA